MEKRFIKNGYTLIEMMVVVVVFAMIAIIASQTIILTLKGTKKAETIAKVRQNLDYAMGSMERQLRGAKSIISTCNSSTSTSITFTDQNDNPVTFSCDNVNSNNQPARISSSSASLTSSEITLTACSFQCVPSNGSSPISVTMDITAQDIGTQNAPVRAITQVTLRSY